MKRQPYPFFYLVYLLIVVLLMGCKEHSKTDVAEVHWDRDMCARCVMVVSDRKNTTQVRNPTTGEKYMFDDIGCAVLWFEKEKIPWKDQAIIWITDAPKQAMDQCKRSLLRHRKHHPYGVWFLRTQNKKFY